jgi:hypothetical protein
MQRIFYSFDWTKLKFRILMFSHYNLDQSDFSTQKQKSQKISSTNHSQSESEVDRQSSGEFMEIKLKIENYIF